MSVNISERSKIGISEYVEYIVPEEVNGLNSIAWELFPDRIKGKHPAYFKHYFNGREAGSFNIWQIGKWV